MTRNSMCQVKSEVHLEEKQRAKHEPNMNAEQHVLNGEYRDTLHNMKCVQIYLRGPTDIWSSVINVL